jgi:hypothetical protein
MVNVIIGESAAKLLSKVPLSINTISRRIQHIAEDLNDKLIEKEKGRNLACTWMRPQIIIMMLT